MAWPIPAYFGLFLANSLSRMDAHGCCGADMTAFTESTVEEAALAWLEATGWQVAHGPELAPDTAAAERRDYAEVVLAQRLRDALARLNPELPAEALEDAFRKLTRPEGADLVQRNRALHRLLVVTVGVHGGREREARAERLFAFGIAEREAGDRHHPVRQLEQAIDLGHVVAHLADRTGPQAGELGYRLLRLGAPSQRGILGLAKIIDVPGAARLLAEVLGDPDAVRPVAGGIELRGPEAGARLDLDTLQGLLFGGPEVEDEARTFLGRMGFEHARLPLQPFAFGLDSI